MGELRDGGGTPGTGVPGVQRRARPRGGGGCCGRGPAWPWVAGGVTLCLGLPPPLCPRYRGPRSGLRFGGVLSPPRPPLSSGTQVRVVHPQQPPVAWDLPWGSPSLPHMPPPCPSISTAKVLAPWGARTPQLCAAALGWRGAARVPPPRIPPPMAQLVLAWLWVQPSGEILGGTPEPPWGGSLEPRQRNRLCSPGYLRPPSSSEGLGPPPVPPGKVSVTPTHRAPFPIRGQWGTSRRLPAPASSALLPPASVSPPGGTGNRNQPHGTAREGTRSSLGSN